MTTQNASAHSPDDLAADFVMGLLDAPAHTAAEQRLLTDTAFASAVDAWRNRLAEFDTTVIPVAPSPALWQRIVGSTDATAIGALPGTRNVLRGATLWDNLAFWRITGLTGAFAALTLAIITFGALTTSKELRRDLIALTNSKPVYVAILVDDATKQAGAVVNTFSNGRVELVPLKNIDVPAGRTLQVWTLWDRAVGPKSVGLTGQSRTIQLNLDNLPETVADQLFEITLEPEGGSPIGRPTGPILFKGNAARAL